MGLKGRLWNEGPALLQEHPVMHGAGVDDELNSLAVATLLPHLAGWGWAAVSAVDDLQELSPGLVYDHAKAVPPMATPPFSIAISSEEGSSPTIGIRMAPWLTKARMHRSQRTGVSENCGKT